MTQRNATNNKQKSKEANQKKATKTTTMPPKKKGKSSSKTKEQNNTNNKTEWDDLDMTSLEQVISKLSNEHQTSLQERIKAQTEYDSIFQSYYESTKQNVSTIQLKIKAKEMEIEDMLYDQNVEIQVYKEKEEYVQYTHEQHLRNVDEDRIQLMKDEGSNYELKLSQNEQQELTLKMEIREREIVYLEEVRNTKARLKQKLEDVRCGLVDQLEKMQQYCINQQKKMNNELDVKCGVEMREMIEQNNLHLYELDRRHGKMYDDTHLYYTNVSKENTARLQRLHDDLDKVNRLISNYESQSKQLEEENDRLSGPLSEYLSKVSVFLSYCSTVLLFSYLTV